MNLEDGRSVDDLRVVDLKSELERRGLSKLGNKATLASRLKEHISESSDATTGDEELPKKPTNGAGDAKPTDDIQPPNAAMLSGGNEFVASYLEQQRKNLLAAKKAAEVVRAAASDGGDSPTKVTDITPAVEETDNIHAISGPPAEEPVAAAEEEAVHAEGSDEQDAEKEGETKKDHDEGGRVDETKSSPEQSEEEAEVDISVPTQEVNDLQDPMEKVEEPMDDDSLPDQGEGKEAEKPVPEADLGEERPPRKRKWARSSNRRPTAVAISSDSLKDVVGSVKEAVDELPEEKLELDYEEPPAVQEPPPKRIIVEEMAGDESRRGRSGSVLSTTKRIVVTDDQDMVVPVGMEEKVTEDGILRMRSPSPPRRPVNCIIHIRCLTRPYTMGQLKELLHRFGNFDETQFYIDNIKSNCMVKFDTEDEASLARSRLHGGRWPKSNPRQLRVEFSDQEALDRHREIDQPKENDRPRLVKNEERSVRRKSRSPEVKRIVGREWDKGKDWSRGQSPPPIREERKRKYSPETFPAREAPIPAPKLLDSLFQKTKTTPCIYWVPLTLDEGTERQRVKKERESRQADRQEKLQRLEAEESRVRVRPRKSPSPLTRVRPSPPSRVRPRRSSPSPPPRARRSPSPSTYRRRR